MSTLLVCSVGGHLAQMHRLAPRLAGVEEERVWVTFDSAQSRSLLAGETTILLDYVGPRDLRGVLRHTGTASAMFSDGGRFSNVVSTGSGIALSFLPLARARGICCHYIESFTRTEGPSLTGRILERVPGVHLYCQYERWAGARWSYRGSVFDAFAPGPAATPPTRIARAVVTLGTMRDYPFDALVRAALDVLPSDADVLWQTGCTAVGELPIQWRAEVPNAELIAAIRDADVVIAHAGCGSALTALEAGKKPVLVPRRAARGENVDEHQQLLAAELARRGVALARDTNALSLADLREAAAAEILSTTASRLQLSR